MSTYRGLVAEMTPLETMQSQTRRFDPGRVRPDGTIASDPFFVEEAKRLESFRPSKEDFERMSRAELLAGLGAVIGGATQRGDIARGLAQLTQQQRQAQRDFRREEREFAGFESNLRREERAEVRAAQQAAEALRQRERQEGRETSRDALAIANAIEANRLQQDQLMANIRNLNLELQMAKEKARTEGLNAQLKLLIDTMEMRLKESQINLNNVRAKQLELGKLGGLETATAASDVF
jgi:flagellar biosynthesis GTPase FlhF